MIEMKINEIIEKLEQIGCQEIICRNYLHQKKLVINFNFNGAKTQLYYHKKSIAKKSLNDIDFYKGLWQLTFYKANEEIVKSDKLGKILQMISLPAFKEYIEKNILE